MTPILDPSCRRRPAGRLARLAAAVVLALAAVTAPVYAQGNNVSALVTGTQQQPPLIWVGATQVACGTACQYVVSSNIGASTAYDQTPGPYTTAAWPPVYGAGLGSPGAVSEALSVPAPPAGATQDGGSIGVARKAAVEFDSLLVLGGKREMSIQTWKDGSGAALVSVTVRLVPTTTKAHYLEFRVPTVSRGWQEAYYVGGPSGQQPIHKMPKQVQARSMVDVIVDGMPVWSGTSHKLKPQRWSLPYLAYLDLQWGPALADDTVNLFLGTLAAGVPRTISLIFRSDLRVNADTCYTDSDGYGNNIQRCDSRREGMSLPAMNVGSGSGPYQYFSYKPHVRVYTY
jgi:hypothetical protein